MRPSVAAKCSPAPDVMGEAIGLSFDAGASDRVAIWIGSRIAGTDPGAAYIALRLSLGLVAPGGMFSNGSALLSESLEGRRIDFNGRKGCFALDAEYRGLPSLASCPTHVESAVSKQVPLAEEVEERSEERAEVVDERRSAGLLIAACAPSVPVLMCTKLVGPEMESSEHGCSSALFRRSDNLRCAEILVLRLRVGRRGDTAGDEAGAVCSSLSCIHFKGPFLGRDDAEAAEMVAERSSCWTESSATLPTPWEAVGASMSRRYCRCGRCGDRVARGTLGTDSCVGVMSAHDDVDGKVVVSFEDDECCKSSDGMKGTGFLLILRTADVAGLTVKMDEDATGPRQR